MPWDAAFEAAPAGTDNASTVDDSIQELKEEIRTRMDTEHHFSVIGHATEDGAHADEFLLPLYVKQGLLPLTLGHEGHDDYVEVTEGSWEDVYTLFTAFHADLDTSSILGHVYAYVEAGVTMQVRFYNSDHTLQLAGVTDVTSTSAGWENIAADNALGASICVGTPKDVIVQAQISAGSGSGFIKRPIIYFEAS